MRRVNNNNYSRGSKKPMNYNISSRRKGKKFLGGQASNGYGNEKSKFHSSGAAGGVGGGRMGILINICHFLCSIFMGLLLKLRKMRTKPLLLFTAGMTIGYVMLLSSSSAPTPSSSTTTSKNDVIDALGKTAGAGGNNGNENDTIDMAQPLPHEDWKKRERDDENSKIMFEDYGHARGKDSVISTSQKTNNIRGSKSKPSTSYRITKKESDGNVDDNVEGNGNVDGNVDGNGEDEQNMDNSQNDLQTDGQLVKDNGDGGDESNEGSGDNENEIEVEKVADIEEAQDANQDGQDGHDQENAYYLSDHKKLPDMHKIPPSMESDPDPDVANADTDVNADVNEDANVDANADADANAVSDANIDANADAVPDVITPVANSDMQTLIVHKQALLSSQSVPTKTTPYIMNTTKLPDSQRKKIMVTGGAGFVGSHLVDKLMMEGHEVVVVDNFFTGQQKNVEHWMKHPNFSLIVHDVTEPIMVEVDQIYHLACPASPPHYQYNPVKTIKTSTMGTIHMLGLAKRVKARMLLASTSEIYGDPEVHPQPETYWGNVNTIGPRACYDEGKRVAETMMYSYRNQNDVEVRVARIFNTFGPRMHPNDGRVVSNFIIQALQGKDMTIYGNGSQTRSFQYVDDLVNGLHALMNSKYDDPVNLGNPDEYSVGDFALYIQKLTKSKSKIIKLEKSLDDPTQRKPNIEVAKQALNWEPMVTVEDGLKKTIEYFAGVLKETGEIIPTGPGASKPRGAEEY